MSMISSAERKPEIKLANLFAPIAAELEESERIFALELESDLPFTSVLVEHCRKYGGKRLRPALVFLCGHACGRTTRRTRVLAAVIEMIHTATLVHDDILDEASSAGIPPRSTPNGASNPPCSWETFCLRTPSTWRHRWNPRSPAAGSAPLPTACAKARCSKCTTAETSSSTSTLTSTSFEGKTAELTAAACRLGAHYAGAAETVVGSLENYGRDLGVAFQIADDVLDIWGEESSTGKSLGTDVAKQKLTLPIIHLLETASPETARKVRIILSEPSASKRHELRPFLERAGSLEYAWERALQTAAKALAGLDPLAESTAKSALRTLAHYVVRRNG